MSIRKELTCSNGAKLFNVHSVLNLRGTGINGQRIPPESLSVSSVRMILPDQCLIGLVVFNGGRVETKKESKSHIWSERSTMNSHYRPSTMPINHHEKIYCNTPHIFLRLNEDINKNTQPNDVCGQLQSHICTTMC